MFIAIGSIIIDDIVLPDGRTFMATLGGGVTHAAMGIRVWTDQVRLISAVGTNFPSPQWQKIRELFDTQGILHRDWVTTRAWQLFEENGHRSEIFRTPLDRFYATNPRPEEVPLELLRADGAYMQASFPEDFYPWVKRLRMAGCKLILWEPMDQFTKPENLAEFKKMTGLVDIVSPNLEETRLLTGKTEPLECVQELLENAHIVALRMGELGSLVVQKGEPVYQVLPVKVPKIIDVTGAGNAYCGGLMVGLAATANLVEAARYAAVSASMALGQFGAVYPIAGIPELALERMKQVKITRVG